MVQIDQAVSSDFVEVLLVAPPAAAGRPAAQGDPFFLLYCPTEVVPDTCLADKNVKA